MHMSLSPEPVILLLSVSPFPYFSILFSSSSLYFPSLIVHAHRLLTGSSGSRAWSDVWDAIGPLCYRCIQGETISEYDAPLSFYRQVRGERRLMEEYHCYAFVPVSGESGVFCLHNPSFE